MARWSWRTLPDERVEVDRGQGYEVIVPQGAAGVQKTADRTYQWLGLAEEKGAKYGVPTSWILGIIFAESGGDPKAENSCCVGLMAIYASIHGFSKAELKDPETNVDYGASLLAGSIENGLDLPQAASVHVAGGGTDGMPHPSQKSPWGMREHLWPEGKGGDGSVGYIDRVVRANNMFVERMGSDLPTPPPKTKPKPATAGMGAGKTLALFALGGALGVGATRLLPRLR